MNVKIFLTTLLNTPIGYCAIFLPPSVNKFLTSNPWTVIKQYEAAIINIEKKIAILLNNINSNVITFIIFHLIPKFVIDIINTTKLNSNLTIFIYCILYPNTCNIILLGLVSNLSKSPVTINSSN